MVNSNERKKSKFFRDYARFSSDIVSLMASKEIQYCFNVSLLIEIEAFP